MHLTTEPVVPREQFLGEVETEVVGHPRRQGGIRPGEYVELQREPENPRDPNAIRVDNGRFQPVGYVSHATASWLAPLVDSGKIRVEGYIAARFPSADDQKPRLVLMVFLQPSGHAILAAEERGDEAGALHQSALEAFRKAQSIESADALCVFLESLEPLQRRNILPQTHLLLALIPGMVSELRAAQNMQTLATLHASLKRLSIGEPVPHFGLMLYPLFWPSEGEPPYLLFSRAIQCDLATAEDVREADSAHRLRLHNRSDRPILIPEGEILLCGQEKQMVNVSTLAAPRSAVSLPASHAKPGCRNRRWLSGGIPSASGVPASSIGLPAQCAGVAVTRSEQVIGVDLFDCASTFQDLWGRLAPAHPAPVQRNGSAAPCRGGAELVRDFFQSVAGHARVRASASGLGEKVEIGGPEVLGSALLYADRLCHLAAFHFDEGGARRGD